MISYVVRRYSRGVVILRVETVFSSSIEDLARAEYDRLVEKYPNGRFELIRIETTYERLVCTPE